MTWQLVRRCEVVEARSFVAVALACFLMAGAVTVIHPAQAEVVAESRRASVSRQLKSMRKNLTLIRRSMASLRQNGEIVKGHLSDVKNSITTLNQRIVTGSISEATPTPTPARVIAASEPTSTYVAFDKYETRRGQATVQHNRTSIAVWFRVLEGGKNVQEYTLKFPFAGRTADQRTADTMVISNCLSQFHRAFDATDGTFFIYASADDNLGVLCASDVYSK